MNIRNLVKKTGPGIIVAATGLGAGDIIAASVAGAQFGTALLWAVIVGAVLKFSLNEGIARWQLVTGKTMLEGWIDYLPRIISWYFLVYLLLWTFMVAAALMAATGLVAYAVFPSVSVPVWGIIHSLLAVLIVLKGGYSFLEHIMKFFIGLMFVTVLYCAVVVMPPVDEVLKGIFIPSIPDNGMIYLLAVIGGVGGSVTIMSYGYWMREAGWKSEAELATARVDLGIAYGLTCLFGVAIILISAGVKPEVVAGNDMVIAVADYLQPVLGDTGKWVFLLGFWGAVFSSMIGVWHGVPYLFANFFYHFKDGRRLLEESESVTSSKAYKGYLLYLSILPMILLSLDRPVWIIILYAVTGAFFMPLIAALLLFMNSRKRWLDNHINRWKSKGLLVACLLMFSFLLLVQVQNLFG